MNIFKSLRRWILGEGAILPSLPADGRSSKDQFGGANVLAEALQYLTPPYSSEVWNKLEAAGLAVPDISQALKTWMNIANTGHRVEFDGAANKIAQAQEIIDALAQRIYPFSAGADGLINAYFNQLGLTGAISSEDVVDVKLKQIEKVVLVPIRYIRWRYKDGEWIPLQITNNGTEIELNTATYAYYAWMPVRNMPYAKPPMIAALTAIMRQADMLENVRFIAKKLGLLGLIEVTLTEPPRRAGETDSEYSARCAEHAKNIKDALSDNYRNGMLVKYDDIEIESHNVTGTVGSAKQIFQLNEEQVFSGIGIDPAMAGRSYSTTETYAGVVYSLLVQDAKNFQMLVKRRMEQTYRLELALHGLSDVDVRIEFEPIVERDPKGNAEAEKLRVETVQLKLDMGVIDRDRAAQELGYAKATGDSTQIATQSKTFARAKMEADPKERLIGRYLAAVAGVPADAIDGVADALADWLDRHSFNDFTSAEDFGRAALQFIRDELGRLLPDFSPEVEPQIDTIYNYWKLDNMEAWRDGTPPSEFHLSEPDIRAIEFLKGLDTWYMSRYVDNETFAESMTNWLREQYLENGEGLFGRADPNVLDAFRQAFKTQVGGLTDRSIQAIVDTSVQRMRNWAHLSQAADAQIATIVIDDNGPNQCPICAEMDGKEIPVAPMWAKVRELSQLAPSDFVQHLKDHNGLLLAAGDPDVPTPSVDELIAGGVALPPYHPHCVGRHWMKT